MNVLITSFTNPFSFFCIVANHDNDLLLDLDSNEGACNDSITISNADHGQYVAVLWRDKWVRGIISMEDQFLIWLVDYGKFIRPNEKTVYTKLPLEYKNLPTKVFEASIHGVVPMAQSLSLDESCKVEDFVWHTWSKAAVLKAEKCISSATNVYFQPIAVLSYKDNNVVLGDLYLQLNNKKIVNIIDELETWPVYFKRNKEVYINDLPTYYKSRRRHRACSLKPVFPNINLPIISLQTSLEQYSAICKNTSPFNFETCDSDSEVGSTVLDVNGAYKKDIEPYKLTTEEIEKYSQMYIQIYDREYNVLQVLLNKIRDLNICEKYKDLKSVGRASRRSSFC